HFGNRIAPLIRLAPSRCAKSVAAFCSVSAIFGRTTSRSPMTPQTRESDYAAQKITVDSVEVVRLSDAAHRTELSIAPSMGNMTSAMQVNGQPMLWSPYETVAQWTAKPAQLGIPFLGPWANRLDQDAFHANGKKYHLNADVISLRRDANGQPIHGLLLFAKHW